ncbi:thioredoxin-like domain-containing protein [Flavobacteriaceae bacterium M23B6Z8]
MNLIYNLLQLKELFQYLFISRTLVFGFLLVLCFSCDRKNDFDGFVIRGLISTKDSTKIYFKKNDTIDSVYIIDNRFEYKGIIDKPIFTEISIENKSEKHVIWLENTNYLITEDDKTKDGLRIEGGDIQNQANMLDKQLKPIHIKMSKVDSMLSRTPKIWRSNDSLINVMEVLFEQETFVIKNFIRKYPDSPISIYELNKHSRLWSMIEVQNLFQQLNTSLKESDYGENIKRYLTLKKSVKTGDPYVDFLAQDIKGNEISFSTFRSKIILLNFWASWCKPCRQENPYLLEIYDNYHAKGLEIISVSIDRDKLAWEAAIAKDKIIWENLLLPKANDSDAYLLYGLNGVPDNFLIDQNGIIIGRNLHGDSLKLKIEHYIGN